ncbi:MAG TPA: hypothetical protein VMT24_00110, partial [Aggregatilineaceae bacterium]|nr:hypothetical protein [Aggregatilineaceae bacterium]
MPSYPLSERQKNLLRSIAPGLQDRTVATEWRLVITEDGRFLVFGVNREGTAWQQDWTGKASRADFDVFVQGSFFISRDK